MGQNTEIQWTNHSFNPWEGCQRVSPGCEHCYAETRNARFHPDERGKPSNWGPTAPRLMRSPAYWNQPRKWNREALEAGVRRRVFCASLADVFEDRPDLVEPRYRLLRLIEETPALDWQLLTKRPQNMNRLAPLSWADGWPANVWAGCTAEDQQRADERIPHLLRVPAAVRFLSCEPLLGPLDLNPYIFAPSQCDDCGSTDVGYDPNPMNLPATFGTCLMGAPLTGEPGALRCNKCRSLSVTEHRPIDWVIVGGESGPGARPFTLEWAVSIVDQCREANVPVFVKQLGSAPTFAGARLRLKDRKGADMSEWLTRLQVREMPRVK